ncbi:MAG TPA: pyruvate kinase, partial [Verrucomicrobiae bacterium]|nr:pyruvate kinase [Verrucomicrobiae bacterium]
MRPTGHISGVPITEYKRTKIIATIGPATAGYESIKRLIMAGANGLRLNFSHGSHAEHAESIVRIRKASLELNKPVAIIQDLQGPKIRLGDFDGEINVKEGEALRLGYEADYTASGVIPIQYDLAAKVKAGERLYLYDGRVRARVTSITGSVIHVTALNSGMLLKRKGINLPDTDLAGDVITEKDKADLAFGATQDIDYVAQSFVQTADDLKALRELMNQHHMTAKLIVKFETRAAVDNIDAIVQEADAIMVARGDLAGETSAETVPIVQHKLIGLGQRYAKPVIIATQTMLSMTDSPAPTRAEVSDVATAILLGADAVMLSEETAMGKYPTETVATMKRIMLRC